MLMSNVGLVIGCNGHTIWSVLSALHTVDFKRGYGVPILLDKCSGTLSELENNSKIDLEIGK